MLVGAVALRAPAQPVLQLWAQQTGASVNGLAGQQAWGLCLDLTQLGTGGHGHVAQVLLQVISAMLCLWSNAGGSGLRTKDFSAQYARPCMRAAASVYLSSDEILILLLQSAPQRLLLIAVPAEHAALAAKAQNRLEQRRT